MITGSRGSKLNEYLLDVRNCRVEILINRGPAHFADRACQFLQCDFNSMVKLTGRHRHLSDTVVRYTFGSAVNIFPETKVRMRAIIRKLSLPTRH